MIRIDDFPSFVNSKDLFNSKRINVYGAEWYITFELLKYCQTNKHHILVNSTSTDQPETLGVFVVGRRSDQKECSFVVETTFKLKHISTAREWRNSHKFCFTSTKNCDTWGYRDFMRIDVILFIIFCQLFWLLTINFRIFWTSTKDICLITHSNCSLMFQFQNMNEFLDWLIRNKLAKCPPLADSQNLYTIRFLITHW